MSKLNDIDVETFLKDSVLIDPLCITDEYVRLPSDLAYWNQRHSDALKAHLRAKIELDRVEAMVYLEKREGGVDGKRLTVDGVNAAVAVDPRVLSAREAAVLAEVEKSRLHGVVSAVGAKKDMLVSLGAHVRQEMDGDPVVRAAHAGFRAQQESKR